MLFDIVLRRMQLMLPGAVAKHYSYRKNFQLFPVLSEKLRRLILFHILLVVKLSHENG